MKYMAFISSVASCTYVAVEISYCNDVHITCLLSNYQLQWIALNFILNLD